VLIARIGIIVLTKSRITKNLSISEIASLSSFLEKVFSAAQKTFSKNRGRYLYKIRTKIVSLKITKNRGYKELKK
jgi:hypothetical protein